MLPQQVIYKKRNGGELSVEEIQFVVAGLSNGALSEGQVAALAMAIWFKGMSRDETVALTLAMRDSGDVLSWDDIDKPIADKHSTGGVGDNVSLMLAPIVASLGLAVPMISGRGLGHTGGTLDKLESIAGYQVMPDESLFRKTVREVGCAIIGQTGELAPADKRLYAIRDVTATVDSIPLITASILSKKLAAGLQTLVLDVKTGNGAFMANHEEAEALARSLVEVANGAGVRTTALLTDMNEPLADAAGNAVELLHAVDFLKGKKAGTRAQEVTLALAAEMLVSSGIESDTGRAARKGSGEPFHQAVHLRSSPEWSQHWVDRRIWSIDLNVICAKAAVELPVEAPEAGVLLTCNTRDIGMSVISLGGGRLRSADEIDHSVGFSKIVPLGTRVEKGEPIAIVHARDEASALQGKGGMADELSHRAGRRRRASGHRQSHQLLRYSIPDSTL